MIHIVSIFPQAWIANSLVLLSSNQSSQPTAYGGGWTQGVRYFNPYGDSFQMPCNAHGHPPFCECGWGGVNYDPWKPKLKVNWSQATSHTIPNASCPVCSAKVFFYRSPDGGAVFFDDLGPPWPKHPCTSNGAHRLTEKIFEERNKKKKNKRKK